MAYGRVNIFSKGGIGCLDNLKTIDIGKNEANANWYIDYVRQRKYTNSSVQDFNDNVIVSFDNHNLVRWHLGFIEMEDLSTREYELYNITTGDQVDPPKGFRLGYGEIDYILNEDMDYITDYYIKYSDGSIKHRLEKKNSQVRLIHRDVVFIANHQDSGFYNSIHVLYKYENRQLTRLQDNINVQTINFL